MVTVKDFVYIKSLTKGAYGNIFLGKKIGQNELYAIKVLSKRVMKMKNMTKLVLNERNALAMSHSPLIVHLFYSLQTEKNIYLIMEYLPGGDLKSLILTCGAFSEANASMYTQEIMLGLFYLHNHGIIHRDLKPDNVLIGSSGHIKLTDFGLSKINIFDKNAQIQQILFTPSQNFKRRNLQYSRTPNQFKSLIDKLVFSMSKSVTRSAKPHEKIDLDGSFNMPQSKSTETVKNEQYDPLQETNFEVQPPSTPTKLTTAFSSYDSPLSSKTSSFLFKTPAKQIIKFKQRACSVNVNNSRYQKTPNHTISYLERAAAFAEFPEPIKISDYEDLQLSMEPEKGLDDSVVSSGPIVRGTPDYIAPELLLQASSVNKQDDQSPKDIDKNSHQDSEDKYDGNNNELGNSKFSKEENEMNENDAKADWWALGVIVFEMLCGYTPFTDWSVERVFQNILNHEIQWPTISEEKIPKDVEDESISTWSKEVVDGLLDPNLNSRWTKDKLSECTFITLYSLPKTKLPMPFIPVLNSEMDTMYHEMRNKVLKLNITDSDNSDDTEELQVTDGNNNFIVEECSI